MHFWWTIAAVGSALGTLVMVAGFTMANGAPQEAAAAALAIGFAVIPYVMARSLQMLRQGQREDQMHRELIEAIRAAGK